MKVLSTSVIARFILRAMLFLDEIVIAIVGVVARVGMSPLAVGESVAIVRALAVMNLIPHLHVGKVNLVHHGVFLVNFQALWRLMLL